MPTRFSYRCRPRGQVHARAVYANEKAILTAVCDPVEAACIAAEKYGADIRGLDAIAAAMTSMPSLSAPTDLHAQQIEQFARRQGRLL